MHKTFLIALFLAATFFITHEVRAADNLFPNGSFESGTTAPTGWTAAKGAARNVVSFIYPSGATDGTRGAGITVTSYRSGDVFWMPATIPVSGSTEYTWSGDSKNSRPVNVIAAYVVGTGTTYETLATVASSTAWKKVTKKFKTPAGATGVRIQHVIKGVGTLAIDNYSLQLGSTTLATSTPPVATTTPPIATTTPPIATTTPPIATTTPPIATTTPPIATTTPPTGAPNLITNGDLELGGTTPTGWTGDFWGNMSATFTYPVPGVSGRGAKVTVNSRRSGDAKWHFNHVPVSPSKIYRYKEAYTSTVPTSVSIEFKKSDGSYHYEWVRDLPASPTWSTYEQDISIPVGAVSLTVLHSVLSVGSLTIDNAVLTEITGNQFNEGLVTFVFDDGPKSVFDNARPILNAAGIKTVHPIITQYASTSGYMSWDEIATLAAEGNEIDSHSRTHPDLTTLSPAQLTSEVAGSKSDLIAHGITPTTFVYPLGGVNDTVKAAVQAAGYLGARGSYFGLNTTATDRYALFDQHVESGTTLAEVKSWIDQARADKRWLILELHEQKENGGQFSNTPAMLQSIVDYVRSTGIRTVTLHEGVQLLNQ